MGAPEPDPDREALAGLVERVTFHNPENGFCILRAKVRGQRGLVTIVGHAATISAGEFVQASGAWASRPPSLRAADHARGHRALPQFRPDRSALCAGRIG